MKIATCMLVFPIMSESPILTGIMYNPVEPIEASTAVTFCKQRAAVPLLTSLLPCGPLGGLKCHVKGRKEHGLVVNNTICTSVSHSMALEPGKAIHLVTARQVAHQECLHCTRQVLEDASAVATSPFCRSPHNNALLRAGGTLWISWAAAACKELPKSVHTC